MTYQNPDLAFDAAIKAGRLSADITADNYAGNYMYMGTDNKDNDLFKHIGTRQYLPVNKTGWENGPYGFPHGYFNN